MMVVRFILIICLDMACYIYLCIKNGIDHVILLGKLSYIETLSNS